MCCGKFQLPHLGNPSSNNHGYPVCKLILYVGEISPKLFHGSMCVYFCGTLMCTCQAHRCFIFMFVLLMSNMRPYVSWTFSHLNFLCLTMLVFFVCFCIFLCFEAVHITQALFFCFRLFLRGWTAVQRYKRWSKVSGPASVLSRTNRVMKNAYCCSNLALYTW